MTDGRSTELLKLAAQALDEGMNPFSDWFLQEHNVTSDECMTLTDQVSLAINILVVMSGDRRYLPVFGQVMVDVAMQEVS